MKNLRSILFADDTTMFTKDKYINGLCRTITEYMLLLRDWLIANSLTLNAHKSYYIIFSMRKTTTNLRVTIGNHVLDRKAKGKFLGVILVDKLRFADYIDHITIKVSKLMGLMYKLKTIFPPEVLKNLYLSLIYQ